MMSKERTKAAKGNLLSDPKEIGAKLHQIRKQKGLSQEETAWAAGLSSRAYADIERGAVNARLDSIIKICNVFEITPDEILIRDGHNNIDRDGLITKLDGLRPSEHKTALQLLQVYIRSCKR